MIFGGMKAGVAKQQMLPVLGEAICLERTKSCFVLCLEALSPHVIASKAFRMIITIYKKFYRVFS